MKTKSVSIVHRRRKPRAGGGPDASRARIVAAARRFFLERGFRRTTADDIAAELGISKATLYKAFRSKEDILGAVLRRGMADIQAGVERLIDDDGLGFVEKMAALLSFLAGTMSELGPILIRDVQKASPGLWQEVLDFRRDKILRNFRIILEAGRREGHFREDVDLDLLLGMFLILIQQLVTPEEVRRSGRAPAAIFASVIKVFFQGILTDKGRQDFAARTPALFEPRKEGAT